MRNSIAALAVLLLVSLPAAVLAQEPAGEISGRVVNDTAGGTALPGAEVTLITYVGGRLEGTSTATADTEGGFLFEDIDLGNTYLISANYRDVDYYYPVVFETGATTAYVEAGVCDTTGSDDNIKTELARQLISIEADSLMVTSFYSLVNGGDTTYVGEGGVLFFSLPEGAYGFEAPETLLADYRLLEGNRVTHLVPFPPGQRQIMFVYRLAKPETDEFNVPFTIDYPADFFELLVAGDNIEVATDRLAPAEPVVDDNGQRFIRFLGEGLPRGAVVNVHLSDTSGGGGFPLQVIWGIIALVIIGAAVYILRRKRAGTHG